MRDYAELVKALNEISDKTSCYYCHGESLDCKTAGCYISDAADAIEELLAAVPKWVSVEERLPEIHRVVLVIKDHPADYLHGYEFACRFNNGEWSGNSRKVLYWMSLPEPPKGVE